MKLLLGWLVALPLLAARPNANDDTPAPPPLKGGTESLKEPPASAPHGHERDGASLGLWSEKDRYLLDTRMNVWIVLTCSRDKNGRTLLDNDKLFEDSYLFITLPNGKVVKQQQGGPVDGLRAGATEFKGGISDPLHKVIRTSGVYKIKWKIGQLESNELKLTVLSKRT